MEVGRLEGASEWVEGGLSSFGPPQTPTSKKPRGVPRQPRKTSTPISEKGQGRTSSTQMSPPLTSPEGEGHWEGGTGLLGSEVMGPVICDWMPQGSVPVPMTPMYTPHQQPQVQPGLSLGGPHRPISPRGDGLGASPINPSGRLRFPTYTVGHPPMVSQQNPMGLTHGLQGVHQWGIQGVLLQGFLQGIPRLWQQGGNRYMLNIGSIRIYILMTG